MAKLLLKEENKTTNIRDCAVERKYGTMPPMSEPLCPSKTIALISNPAHQALREKISGVYSAATKCGWQVFQTAQSPTAANIRKIKAMINPIGFIIDPLSSTKAVPRKPFGKTPVVLISRDYHRATQIFDCSCQNTIEPVYAAIQTLREYGDCTSFGFVGHPSKAPWSRDRGAIFKASTSTLAPFFEYLGEDAESNSGCRQLVKWLQDLPKPSGILLATDHLAPSVFNAIHKAGITVPDEMAIISVDDIHEICLNVTPNLTSVSVNFFKCGENAVELLKRRIRHPDRSIDTLTYGVIYVSKRASTRKPYTDKRVTKAVEFIEGNIASKISSLHVVKVMGCGRRQAEQLFKAHTGHSILRAIQKSRIEKAMTLLKSGNLPIEEIPSFCGYDSAAFFKTIFRRETGMSMREWRRQAAH